MADSGKKTEKLREILNEVWKLTESPLYKYRKKNNYYPVLGEGSHDAAIVFVGEAPGKNEAETGRPFCGAAGRILDELLSSAELPREEVYITNIVKDRPPGNRDPKQEEIDLYSPFLIRQIKIIQPEIIATLGRFSMQFIMKEFGLEDKLSSISRIHGKVFETEAGYGKAKIIPLFHPAMAIYNPKSKQQMLADFAVLKKVIDE